MKYKHNAYRRAALSELRHIQHHSKLPHLLRKTALYAFKRSEIAPLIGSQWEIWLDSKCEGSQFATSLQGLLNELAYTDCSQISAQKQSECTLAVEHWIRCHEVKND